MQYLISKQNLWILRWKNNNLAHPFTISWTFSWKKCHSTEIISWDAIAGPQFNKKNQNFSRHVPFKLSFKLLQSGWRYRDSPGWKSVRMTLSWLSGLKKCPDDAVMTLRVEKVSRWRCHDSSGWKRVRMTLSWLSGLKKCLEWHFFLLCSGFYPAGRCLDSRGSRFSQSKKIVAYC